MTPWIIAQAADGTRVVNARLQDIGRGATEGADVPWGALLIAGGLIIAVVTVASVRRLHRVRDIAPGPRLAFLLATRRLGLNWRQRLLLLRVARGVGIEHPVTLLLVPGILHDSARQYVAGGGMRRRDITMRRVAVVERLLYARAWPHSGDSDVEREAEPMKAAQPAGPIPMPEAPAVARSA